jgi:hypothetical protein
LALVVWVGNETGGDRFAAIPVTAMKMLTIYSISAALFLPGLLLSSDPMPQKVVAVAIFCFHAGLVYLIWGNFDTKAIKPSNKNKGWAWAFAAYASGVIAFIAAISATNDPWSLSHMLSPLR